MPRSRQRSAVKKKKTNPKNALDEDIIEKTTKANEAYRNLLKGAQSRRKLIEQVFDNYKETKIRKIDRFIFRLPPDIASMTVEDFFKNKNLVSEMSDSNVDGESATVREEASLQQEPMEMDVFGTVDEALMDLQQFTAAPKAETKKKPSRKAKKAPTTTRKKKKPANQVMETPLHNGPAPATWKDTPFISLTQRKGEESSRYLTPAEASKAVFKLVCVMQDGSQVMCVPRSAATRGDIEMMVRGVQERIMQDAVAT